jgi:hypothetical protein
VWIQRIVPKDYSRRMPRHRLSAEYNHLTGRHTRCPAFNIVLLVLVLLLLVLVLFLLVVASHLSLCLSLCHFSHPFHLCHPCLCFPFIIIASSLPSFQPPSVECIHAIAVKCTVSDSVGCTHFCSSSSRSSKQ